MEAPNSPKLLDQLRTAIRLLHYSYRTEQAYTHWVKRFLHFHKMRHPREMGSPEITAFISHLAEDRNISASTQNQALAAVVFLYQRVLGRPVQELDGIIRAKRPTHIPVVLSPDEGRRVIDPLKGRNHLMAMLLYGAGLRLHECLRLRVKDIDFDYRQITVMERGPKTGSRYSPKP